MSGLIFKYVSSFNDMFMSQKSGVKLFCFSTQAASFYPT